MQKCIESKRYGGQSVRPTYDVGRVGFMFQNVVFAIIGRYTQTRHSIGMYYHEHFMIIVR